MQEQVPANLHATFRENVRRRLKEIGLTQKGLSVAMEVTEASVSQLLSGRYVPTLNMVDRVAKVLNTTSIYLLTPADLDSPLIVETKIDQTAIDKSVTIL
ncbi:MAG: helix-turn-helix domain-containing protein [Planctomycetota bacterium]|jgi:transcriptional regulator with XRE-family HTH domain